MPKWMGEEGILVWDGHAVVGQNIPVGMGAGFGPGPPHPREDEAGEPNSPLHCWFLLTCAGFWDDFG